MSPILDLIKLIAFCKIRLSLPRITLHSLFELLIPLNFLDYTAEKNMTNTLTLVPVGTDVGFDDRLEVLLY